jgi:putative phage-type endonuclease
VAQDKQDRRGFIGGSDIAAMLGVSPWKTPYQLWEEKMGISDETEDSEERAKVLKRGKRLEPVVMEMLQDEYEIIVTDRNLIHIDDEYEWMRAEIDFEYLLPDNSIGNGDVKTVHPYAAKDWGESGTDQVPPYYVAQFQWGMMPKKREICAVAALIGADDLRLYYVPRDEELISFIRARAIDFWNNHVLAGVPPPATSAEDAHRILARFDGVSVVASDELRRQIAWLKGVKAAEKRLELKREEYETAIKLTLALATGNAEGKAFAITDGAKTLATWNPQTTSRIDTKALKERHPEVATEVTKQTTFRVLRLK